MQIELGKIIIRKRVRKNLGDLASLMESLRRHGLLNPVVINTRNELVAGHRRIESAKRLGWSVIEVRIVEGQDKADLIEMEIEENTQRKNLTTDELAEAYLRLDKLRHPSFFVLIWRAIVKFFRRLFRRRPR
ncbi:MAG: ParB N-terminal domain-containing protein [Spirochaetaceae bacterium]|nr:ParB N-terminal domain-containing protein [Spirochaetaceae bacterium]